MLSVVSVGLHVRARSAHSLTDLWLIDLVQGLLFTLANDEGRHAEAREPLAGHLPLSLAEGVAAVSEDEAIALVPMSACNSQQHTHVAVDSILTSSHVMRMTCCMIKQDALV